MLIMAMMKEKWQREAREEAREQAREQALRESREREIQQLATILDLQRRVARLEAERADGEEVA